MEHLAMSLQAALVYLAIALDKLLDYGSRYVTWHPSREVIDHTFRSARFPLEVVIRRDSSADCRAGLRLGNRANSKMHSTSLSFSLDLPPLMATDHYSTTDVPAPSRRPRSPSPASPPTTSIISRTRAST